MTDAPSLVALARAIGDLVQERFVELEAHVGALTARVAELELHARSLERRVDALQVAEKVRAAAERRPGETEPRG